MRIRTAVFGVYVAVSLTGAAVLLALVLRDVRLRYVESMRRTLGDTAVFLAGQAASAPGDWRASLRPLPSHAGRLRVFASDPDGRLVFDSAAGADVGLVYDWPMTGGGPAASAGYSLHNVALAGDELRVRAPILRDGGLVGWVGVGRPLATLAEGIAEARGRLIGYAAVIGAALLAAGWWVSARLARSLERLTRHVNALREGRRSAPPSSRAEEIRTLAGAFEAMRAALDEKAQVERYAQALVHQVKAPLTGIRGAAELLQEDLSPEDRSRFLAHLSAESDRLQRIVDRLLALASLEAAHPGAGGDPVDLTVLLGEVANEARGGAQVLGVRLTTDLPDSAPFRGQAALLRDAAANLVQNAVEFSPRGGEVRIVLRTEDGGWTVVVEDDGPGVPDYALERVFERFYSLPRPGTGRKSSGLGLSIVREIARLHGGGITLGNRPAGGARAVLRLPRVAPVFP